MDRGTQHFIGLDIGTSTVRCVAGIANTNEGGKPSIVGYGSAPNVGMRKGVIVHLEDVIEAVSHAVSDTERLTGIPVHNATVNVNGSHVAGINSRGVIAISAANREISVDDRLRVEEAATIVKLPPNREIIQVFAKNYRLDGQDNIKDPVGMEGVRLEVDTHIVTVATPSLRNLDLVLEKAHIHPAHHTVSSLAAAEAVMTRQQKEAGTVLLDIGAGTTNLAIIEDGEVHHVAVIPMGGTHITNDLAIGLKTDLDVAEEVKVKHANLGVPARTTSVNVTVNDERYNFPTDDIQMIVEARAEELFEYVDKELKRVQRSRKLPGGAVLVGGSAKLPGIAEFAKEKLQLPARIGHLQPISGLTDTVDDPAYFTATGLMLLDMLLLPMGERHGKGNGGMFSVVEGMFRKLKR